MVPVRPHPAPTVQVHKLAFGDVGVDGVENPCGRFQPVWSAQVLDRETVIRLALRLQPLRIGRELSSLSEVDKGGDPGISQRR